VTVNPAPTFTISLPDTVICDANTSSLVFDASVSTAGNYAYQWTSTANLNNPNILTPTFFIPTEGMYEYILEVIDQATGCSLFDTLTVDVSPFSPGTIASTSTPFICRGEAANLSSTATGTDLSYQWQESTSNCTTNFTDIAGATASTYTITSLIQETYFRILTYDSDGACVDTSNCVTITLLSTPQISARDTISCVNEPIDLSVLVEGTPQNTLEYGTDLSFGGTNLVSSSMTTTYYVRDSNTTNMCVDTASIVVTIVPCDWGDLPDLTNTTAINDYQTTNTNNGPVHIINPAITLGTTIDGETDGQSSTDALGDGTDEDGLTIFGGLDIIPGGTIRLPLDYTNTTGSPAHIEAWIDWNANGEFDAGEMVFDEVDASAGTYDLITINVPTDAVTDEFLGVRIRISNQDNMTPYGHASEGEVEDYLIRVDCKSQICLPAKFTIKR